MYGLSLWLPFYPCTSALLVVISMYMEPIYMRFQEWIVLYVGMLKEYLQKNILLILFSKLWKMFLGLSNCEESWAPKNWCFWTGVLEKTLESPLDCKEIQPLHSERDQPWDFFGRTDAKAETPVLWPPDVKSWLIGKDSDAGRDWGQEWESQFLGRLIRSLGVPKERRVWNSQGGRKDKPFFPSLHSLGLYNNNVSCLRTVSGLNLLANSVILKCKLWE